MKKSISTILLAGLSLFYSKNYAQDTTLGTTGLKINGSADVYWKYDFAKHSNINTFFTEDQNSISLGMLDLAISKNTGKAFFVGELSFGPRGQYRSLLNGDQNPTNADNSFHLQNLYIDYAFTDKLNLTAGFMGTFVGYEVISPTANFHYSTSYLFGAGPFQNAGIKATYSFSDKISGMIGLFNDWNTYQDFNGISHIGSQISITPNEKTNVYLNFLTGSSEGGNSNYSSGTLLDLVANYSFNNKFSLGINATDYSFKSDGGYYGAALYPKFSIQDNIGIGLRGEYFKVKDEGGLSGDAKTALTLTGNFKHGGLVFIPELRWDNSKLKEFTKSDLITATPNAIQFSAALVYSF
ncbi:outer membrane beta-barrel protein [Pseudopedobacter beijingensis]|uniref:Outer membrane beta-barrel protein n=1 Tax=Pseudopedobacter beijingensis TaxID=1207056 RepID=A0ABW4IB60_9SPHI